MSQETCIEEIMENELKSQVQMWSDLYKAEQSERISLQMRCMKLEMILEVLARHNQLPDLAYELVPELRKPAQE